MKRILSIIALSLIALTGFAQNSKGTSEITHWNLLTNDEWSPNDIYTSESYITTEGLNLTINLENVGVLELEVYEGNPVRTEDSKFYFAEFRVTTGERLVYLIHKESGQRAISLRFKDGDIILLYLGSEHIVSPVSLIERSGI